MLDYLILTYPKYILFLLETTMFPTDKTCQKAKPKPKKKKQVLTQTYYWMIKIQAKWENVCPDSAPLTAPSRAYSGGGGKRGRKRGKERKRKEKTKHSFNPKFLYSSDP